MSTGYELFMADVFPFLTHMFHVLCDSIGIVFLFIPANMWSIKLGWTDQIRSSLAFLKFILDFLILLLCSTLWNRVCSFLLVVHGSWSNLFCTFFEPETITTEWCLRKQERLTKVNRIFPLSTINIFTKSPQFVQFILDHKVDWQTVLEFTEPCCYDITCT